MILNFICYFLLDEQMSKETKAMQQLAESIQQMSFIKDRQLPISRRNQSKLQSIVCSPAHSTLQNNSFLNSPVQAFQLEKLHSFENCQNQSARQKQPNSNHFNNQAFYTEANYNPKSNDQQKKCLKKIEDSLSKHGSRDFYKCNIKFTPPLLRHKKNKSIGDSVSKMTHIEANNPTRQDANNDSSNDLLQFQHQCSNLKIQNMAKKLYKQKQRESMDYYVKVKQIIKDRIVFKKQLEQTKRQQSILKSLRQLKEQSLIKNRNAKVRQLDPSCNVRRNKLSKLFVDQKTQNERIDHVGKLEKKKPTSILNFSHDLTKQSRRYSDIDAENFLYDEGNGKKKKYASNSHQQQKQQRTQTDSTEFIIKRFKKLKDWERIRTESIDSLPQINQKGEAEQKTRTRRAATISSTKALFSGLKVNDINKCIGFLAPDTEKKSEDCLRKKMISQMEGRKQRASIEHGHKLISYQRKKGYRIGEQPVKSNYESYLYKIKKRLSTL